MLSPAVWLSPIWMMCTGAPALGRAARNFARNGASASLLQRDWMQPEPGAWSGMTGRVTAHIPHYVGNAAGKTGFLCGSKQMLKDVTEILVTHGMDRKKIKKEQFW